MVTHRNRGCWSVFAAGVGALLLVVGVGWLARVWIHNGIAVAVNLATVLGFLLAAVVAVVGLSGWVRRQRVIAAVPVAAEQLQQAMTTLAEVVAEQWEREATVRSLGDPEPMPVRWHLSPTVSGRSVMDHPEVIAARGLAFAGTSERIAGLVAAFRQLDRRRLVITGGPGTGKTTLAVQLLLELLAHRQPSEPVPVLFSLLGWNPQEQPRLQDWLITRLERDYPALRGFGADTAGVLAERGKILPILDGLDEVSVALRPSIITALNQAALPAAAGLILTSRRAEYRDAVIDAGDVLTAAAVIAPLALTRLDAASYLRKYLPPNPAPAWEMVLGHLETGTATDLVTVTANPLGLWLVRAVYLDGHRDPTPLVQNTHPARSGHPTLQAHLFDQLIPAVLRSRPPTPRGRSADPHAPLRPRRQYDPDDVRKWLTTLAEELRVTETRDWLWWHLARHTFSTTRTARTARLAVGLMGGLVVCLVVCLVSVPVMTGPVSGPEGSLAYRLGYRLGEGLALGLVAALVSGVAGGLVFRLTGAPQHADLRLRGRIPKLFGSLAHGLGVGMAVGLAGGLALGLVLALSGSGSNGVFGSLLVGLAGGLAFGPVFGLVNFAASPSIAQRANSPVRSQRDDRQLTVLVTSTVGLLVGLMLGVAFGLPAGLANGLIIGEVSGVASGLVGGLANRAWPAFLVASGWLAVRHRFPLRLMVFLDDAYRLGLLRVVGSAYQFRHAELQDDLAPKVITEPAQATPKVRS